MREILDEIRIAADETRRPRGMQHADWIRELRARVDGVNASMDDLRRAYDEHWNRVRPYLDADTSGMAWPEIVIILAEREKRQAGMIAAANATIERLKVPFLASGSLPPNYLHTAHMPGDWSTSADEWFVYRRHIMDGKPTPFVSVSWRRGPGVSNGTATLSGTGSAIDSAVAKVLAAWHERSKHDLKFATEVLGRFVAPKEPLPKREPEPCTRPPCTDPCDLLELAWGLLANVSGGDWHAQDPKWHGAMIAWRDDWHRYLSSARGLPSSSKRCAHADVERAEIAEAHVQALCGAAKNAIRAMGRAWGLVGASEQPALDRAQVALASAVTAAQ